MEASRTGPETWLTCFIRFSALPVSFFRCCVTDVELSHYFPCASIGLSIVGYPGLVDLDPIYCMPAAVIENKGLKKDWEGLPRRQL